MAAAVLPDAQCLRRIRRDIRATMTRQGGRVVSSPLFRKEVIQARQAKYLGAIRLGRNPSFVLVAWVAVVLVGALISFAVWGEVSRKATVPGLLVPTLGTLEVSVPVAGVLVEVRVREGQRIEAGQVLFVVSTDRATTQGSTAALVAVTVQQRLAALEAERAARELQARQRRDALQDRIRRLEVERESTQQEAEFAKRREMLAQRGVERLLLMAREGFVSEAQANVKQDEMMEIQARAESARRAVVVLRREQQSLRNEIAGLDAQWAADNAQFKRLAVELRQEAIENDARKTVAVAAPSEGVVTTLHLPSGAAVQPGQTLATVLPWHALDVGYEVPLEAHLYATSRTAGFIQLGQSVRLRLAAFPYQKFGMVPGRVMHVARTPTNPKDLPAGQAQALLVAAGSQEPMYRIVVKLASQAVDAYGERLAFKPGMALEASVTIDRRATWEWIFSPILSAAEKT